MFLREADKTGRFLTREAALIHPGLCCFILRVFLVRTLELSLGRRHHAFVAVDFFVETVEGFLHGRHALDQAVALIDEQTLSGLAGRIPLLKEGHIFDESLNLYACLTHTFHQGDPAAGHLVVIPDAAACPRDGRDQADPFIIPERVGGNIEFLADFCDCHERVSFRFAVGRSSRNDELSVKGWTGALKYGETEANMDVPAAEKTERSHVQLIAAYGSVPFAS